MLLDRPEPFRTDLAKFVYTRTYARWKEDLKRRETWAETVDRATEFLFARAGTALSDEERLNITQAIYDHDALPSMRLLWSAGPAATKNEVALFNCAYAAVDDLRVFDEALFILMSGTGFGFSVEEEYVESLPKIQKPKRNKTHKHVIADSREGWAEALRVGLDTWYQGGDVEFDYSQLRPQGAKLLTMGGRSSGPEPLRQLLDFAREKIRSRAGKRLRSIDAHDLLCMIGEVVVAGGVRRSSLISLSDLEDQEMRNAKFGAFWNSTPYRAMANNSVAYNEKPSAVEFMEEFLSLAKSGSGERGIFNRATALSTAPRRKKYGDFGTNPCFAGDTIVHTAEGHIPIKDLVGKTVQIWDGASWVTTDSFRKTAGNQQTLKVTLQDGAEIIATPYHKFILESGERVELKDLKVGDKLMLSDAPYTHGTHHEAAAYGKGFLVGDGTYGSRPILSVYFPKYVCEDRLVRSFSEIPQKLKLNTNTVPSLGFAQEKTQRRRLKGLTSLVEDLSPWVTEYKKHLPLEIFNWDEESKVEFIAGVFDADGSIMDTSHGFGYQISSIHKQCLLDLQLLLKTLGVFSKISLNKTSGQTDFKSRGGVCQTQALYRLTVSQASSIVLSNKVHFERLGPHKDRKTSYTLKPRRNKVVSIEPHDVQDVYCCTIPTNHSFCLSAGVRVGQCGEINLRSQEFCNLTSIIARPEDTVETLRHKVRMASMIGTIQSTFTNFPYLRDGWKQNCDEERLLGVSISGQMDCPLIRDRDSSLLEDLRNEAIQTNRDMAQRLGINPSVAITTGKPAGTESQVVYSGSGAHTWWDKYFIRRIRISATDPLFTFAKTLGVPAFPEVGQDPATAYTWVLEFPVKAPEGSITRHDVTAIEQLEHWLHLKTKWCEHNQSITCYVPKDSWIEVMNWVYGHWDKVGGLSFLPTEDHIYRLAPYESVSQEEYERRVAEFPELDYSLLATLEEDDNTTGARDYACTSGSCEI